MFFRIVVDPPCLVRLLDLRPGLGLGEGVVCHAPLDRDYVELNYSVKICEMHPPPEHPHQLLLQHAIGYC